MKKVILILTVFALAAPMAFGIGEARLTGVVTDTEGNPLAGVTVHLVATEKRSIERTVETDEEGKFTVFLVDGTIPYEFTFSKEGYLPLQAVWKLNLLPQKNEKEVKLAKVGSQMGDAPVENPAFAIFNEGVHLANEGKDAEAVAKIQEAVAVDPTLIAGWSALARLHARTDNWAKAAEAGEKARELGEEDEVLNSILADAYTKLGNNEKAAEYKRLAPANPAALFNQAVPFLNDNNDVEAEKLLKRAVEMDDKFAKAHYELGSLYARQGKNSEARKHLTKYLALEPEGENAAFARDLLKYLS